MIVINNLNYNRYPQLDNNISIIYDAKKEGIIMYRRTKESKEWSKKVIERDSYKCRLCESENNLCTHHIIPWKISVKHRFDLDNGLTLCPSCHAKIEGYQTGHKHSPEIRKKFSMYRKGKPSWNKGKKLTEEHKENLSESHIGQIPWNKDLYTEPEKIRRCKICGNEKEIQDFTPIGKYRTRTCKKCRNKKLKERRKYGNK